MQSTFPTECVLREGQGDSGFLKRIETTSAVEGQQDGLLEKEQAGLWETPTKSDFLLDAEIRLSETFDWPDHVTNFCWLLRGRKQVWFDYLALLEYGLSGAQLEELLNRHGIQVYGKMICTEGDTYPAFVLVDKSRERQVRRFFAKLGILLE